MLKDWLPGNAGYVTPPGALHSSDPVRLALPLFKDVKRLRVEVV